MQKHHFLKAGILCLGVATCFFIFWEWYWRNEGFAPTYNDDKVLWSNSRKQIYHDTDQATVFIGASRIKFDIDIPTWEKLTHERAIQLAIVGTSFRKTLEDLANDPQFHGKLIVDMTETIFFQLPSRDKSAIEAIEYYQDETPAQNVGAHIDFALESKIASLEHSKSGLNAALNRLRLANRPGVAAVGGFPIEFSVNDFNRQTRMTPMFIRDTQLQNLQKQLFGRRQMEKIPRITGKSLDSILLVLKNQVDKIRSRGGKVMFVRLPSSGKVWEKERVIFSRAVYWDKLLSVTGCEGVHFKDYPAIANFNCPEDSHLTPTDAITYTSNLVEIITKEKGWKLLK